MSRQKGATNKFPNRLESHLFDNLRNAEHWSKELLLASSTNVYEEQPGIGSLLVVPIVSGILSFFTIVACGFVVQELVSNVADAGPRRSRFGGAMLLRSAGWGLPPLGLAFLISLPFNTDITFWIIELQVVQSVGSFLYAEFLIVILFVYFPLLCLLYFMTLLAKKLMDRAETRRALTKPMYEG